MSEQLVVIKKHLDGLFDFESKRVSHSNCCGIFDFVVVLSDFSTLGLRLDVQSVQRKDRVSHEVGQVLG